LDALNGTPCNMGSSSLQGTLEVTYSGTGQSLPVSLACKTTLAKLTVNFHFLYSNTANAYVLGSFSSSPALPAGNCSGASPTNSGATCVYFLQPGTTVTLTAVPINGSTFGGWSGSVCSGTGTCTLFMGGDRAVDLYFQ